MVQNPSMAKPKKTTDPELRIDYVALSAITDAENNPRRHDGPSLDDSVKRHGFFLPMSMNEKTGRLVAGHGRKESLERQKGEGAEPPKYVRVRKDGEWMVPVIMGAQWETEGEAFAALVAANRVSEGLWDREALSMGLRGMVEEDPTGMAGLGFSDSDMKDLMKLTEPVPAVPPPDDFPTYGSGIQTDHQCPSCGYQWSGKTK